MIVNESEQKSIQQKLLAKLGTAAERRKSRLQQSKHDLKEPENIEKMSPK